MLKRIRQPELYQGIKKKNRYFEGWYYKLVDATGRFTLAFIPGISLSSKDPHAFIQVFISELKNNLPTLSTFYFRFPNTAFVTQDHPFQITIDNNLFSKSAVSLHLKNDAISIDGDISLSNLTPLKTSLYAPNIMGPFAYLTFMECYHGVISMNHTLRGSIHINQIELSFDGGKGYLEKDWGKSFPSAYVWIQSNHFKNNQTSFMFSYAHIPFGKLHFKGLIVNLVIDDKEYRFATYNGSKVKVEELWKDHVHYVIKKRNYLLDIQAHSVHETDLPSPKDGEMINHIKEGLSGEITITLYYKNRKIYEDVGLHAGIEIMKSK